MRVALTPSCSGGVTGGTGLPVAEYTSSIELNRQSCTTASDCLDRCDLGIQLNVPSSNDPVRLIGDE